MPELRTSLSEEEFDHVDGTAVRCGYIELAHGEPGPLTEADALARLPPVPAGAVRIIHYIDVLMDGRALQWEAVDAL